MTSLLEGKYLKLRQASVDDVEARISLGNHAEVIEMFAEAR